MKTDLLTFFQPGESAGTAWTFPVQIGESPLMEIWAFVAGEVDLSQLAITTVSSEEDCRSLVNAVQAAVQQHGGILLQARAHNDVIRAHLWRVEAAGYTPPRRMLRLSVAAEPRFEEIAESVDLEVGDHLIIPVSAQAEERLRAFCKELKGLPSDLESSILNVIRRPSLEWRIERIERTLSLPPATRFEEQRSRIRSRPLLGKMLDLVMRPVPLGPAIAAALLLTAGSLTAYEAFLKPPGESTVSDSPDEPAAQGGVQPDSQPNTQSKGGESGSAAKSSVEIEPSLAPLFSALKESQNAGIKALYESHFKSYQKEPMSKSSPVPWGIAKLQALHLGFVQDNDALLQGALLQAGLKDLFKAPARMETLEDHKEVFSLVAWSFCQQSGKPELPRTNNDPQEPLPLSGVHCNDLNSADAAAGIQELADWVRTKKAK